MSANTANSGNVTGEIEIQIENQQELLAVWTILSGETNVRGMGKSKNTKATVCPLMTCTLGTWAET